MLLGRHEITGTLGRGGSGVVYRARSPEGRDLAIKVLLGRSNEARARFEREKRILGALGEGFVPLLESGETREGPFIVMPLLTGGTLRTRLEAGPLPPDEARALGVRLALALGRAHAAGIAHRDVKPENIIFTEAGEPLLADLGLAKHFDRSAGTGSVSLSYEGELRGTAGYMAPEQASNAKEADARADVFGLCAVLYEALTGEPPFKASSLVELMGLLERAEHTPVRAVRRSVPRALARVVERGLARLPSDRFADGAELARALRASESGSSSKLAAAALGVVLALAAVVISLARPAPPPPAPVVAPPVPPPPPRPVPPAPPKEPGDARAFFERARARAGRGETRDAIDDYTRGLERTPDADAYVARGLLHEAKGELDPALEDYSAAYELDPAKNAVAANYRGSILARKGAYDLAAIAFTNALEIDPGMKIAWLNRGVANLWLGRLDLAIADCSRVIALDPELGEGWAMRGQALLRKGDAAAAIRDLEKATALMPDNTDAWMALGTALQTTREPRRAAAALDRAVALAPARGVAWQLRGVARSDFDLDGAITDEEKARSLDPKLANDNLVIYFMRRADKRAAAGDAQGAIADLRRFLEKARPDHPDRAAVAARLEKLGAR